jgi:hypothetical protein
VQHFINFRADLQLVIGLAPELGQLGVKLHVGLVHHLEVFVDDQRLQLHETQKIKIISSRAQMIYKNRPAAC